MELYFGYVGLIVAYLIIITILSCFVIKSKNGNVFVKSVIIFVIVWYGWALYYSSTNFMSWPKNVAEKDLPAGSMVYSFFISEPNLSTREKGTVYLWLLQSESFFERRSKGKVSFFDKVVKKVFNYNRAGVYMRSYSLSYSRELHEKLSELSKQQSNGYGRIMILDFGKGIGGGLSLGPGGMFQIVNPRKLLPKEQSPP